MNDVEHYVVVRCACGATPSDSASDQGALQWVANHIQGADHPLTKVRFVGGPWDGETASVVRATAPVFSVGHPVGNLYFLDTKSEDVPTYYWNGAT